jgi:hypothetical protein
MTDHEHHSEIPNVWISYDHGPEEGNQTFAYEGTYAPDDTLPFEPSESAGVEFEMDNVSYEICGDLGGHAVYRRLEHESALYTMSWETFAQSRCEGTIQLT